MRTRHLLLAAPAPLALLLVGCTSASPGSPGADASVPLSNDASSPTTDASTPIPDAGSSTDASNPSDDAGPATDAGTTDAGATDVVTSSFLTLGCNRIQKADWVQATDPSSANLGQLQQDFTDIAALADAPKYFFFTGDLVLGLVPDLQTLQAQLAAWTQLYADGGLGSKTTLIPVTGNHESLQKPASVEYQNNGPDGGADQIWTAWLTASNFASKAGNGPTNAAPNADALLDDQSKLSYSFDDGANHYVVLNTDTWTSATDSTDAGPIGWVPLNWLTSDLAAAQANATTQNIFVFGHKPLVSPAGATDSADVINPSLNANVISLLDSTAKVKGYFCAHYHAWDARRLGGTTGVYQIIAGNAGSTLDATWNPPSTYYGFTEVRVHASGAVGVVSYQRAVPSPYDSTTGILAAAAQPELIIAQ